MGNFSRDTFDRLKHYVGVRLQQGVPIVDADWNEWEDIRKHELQCFLKWFVGNGVPQGNDGFRIVPHPDGAENDFTIKGGENGQPGCCLVEGKDVVIGQNINYSGQQLFQDESLAAKWGVAALQPLSPAPLNGDRTDTVYLDVWEREVDAVEDDDLINPAIGIETCVRVKREWVVRVAEGQTEPPTPSQGHVYYAIAQLTRADGINTIPEKDINDLRQTGLTLQHTAGTVSSSSPVENATTSHTRQVNASYYSSAGGGQFSQVNASNTSTASGDYYSQVNASYKCSASGVQFSQVNASTNSTASGTRSQVNASDESTASGEYQSQVNASFNSIASGNKSQVNASHGSAANGEHYSQVNASEVSTASGTHSQVNASQTSTASSNITQVNASSQSTAGGIHYSQVNASYNSNAIGEEFSQVNASHSSTASGNHHSQVNASTGCTASGENCSQVNASNGCTASGGNCSQVNASQKSTASAIWSQVNASFDSTASGVTFSQVNASHTSTANAETYSQVNASYNSTASGRQSSQVNASHNSTASGDYYSQVNACNKGTASGTHSQVNASDSSTASGTRSQVNASRGSTAGNDMSQVNASAESKALGQRSQVNASGTAITNGMYSQVNASDFSTAIGTSSQVNASRRVLSKASYIVCGGYAAEGEPSPVNRKWQIDSRNGNINVTGTVHGGAKFSDYGEYFENLKTGEINMGILIALEGAKVRPAKKDEEFIGVVSGTAAIRLGDSPFCWQGRYVYDEWGRPVYEEIKDPAWQPKTAPDKKWEPNKDQTEADRPMIPIETEEDRPIIRVQKENPEYDISKEQIPRSERPDEWTLVGLLGQVYVRCDGTVKPGDFVKSKGRGMGTSSPEKTKLKAMKVTKPFDGKYAVVYCLLS